MRIIGMIVTTKVVQLGIVVRNARLYSKTTTMVYIYGLRNHLTIVKNARLHSMKDYMTMSVHVNNYQKDMNHKKKGINNGQDERIDS
tara:strand:+ start:6529 stop:6789 length:261 start_codon:yes stop_codon:yes gene_type:complete